MEKMKKWGKITGLLWIRLRTKQVTVLMGSNPRMSSRILLSYISQGRWPGP